MSRYLKSSSLPRLEVETWFKSHLRLIPTTKLGCSGSITHPVHQDIILYETVLKAFPQALMMPTESSVRLRFLCCSISGWSICIEPDLCLFRVVDGGATNDGVWWTGLDTLITGDIFSPTYLNHSFYVSTMAIYPQIRIWIAKVNVRLSDSWWKCSDEIRLSSNNAESLPERRMFLFASATESSGELKVLG